MKTFLQGVIIDFITLWITYLITLSEKNEARNNYPASHIVHVTFCVNGKVVLEDEVGWKSFGPETWLKITYQEMQNCSCYLKVPVKSFPNLARKCPPPANKFSVVCNGIMVFFIKTESSPFKLKF